LKDSRSSSIVPAPYQLVSPFAPLFQNSDWLSDVLFFFFFVRVLAVFSPFSLIGNPMPAQQGLSRRFIPVSSELSFFPGSLLVRASSKGLTLSSRPLPIMSWAEVQTPRPPSVPQQALPFVLVAYKTLSLFISFCCFESLFFIGLNPR